MQKPTTPETTPYPPFNPSSPVSDAVEGISISPGISYFDIDIKKNGTIHGERNSPRLESTAITSSILIREGQQRQSSPNPQDSHISFRSESQGEEEDQDGEDEEQKPQNESVMTTSRFRRWLDEHPIAYNLDNRGSVARDHLANERTALGWLRTSLSFATVGVSITQLFNLSPKPHLRTELEERHGSQLAKVLGMGFVSLSLLTLLLGTYRFFQVQYHLVESNDFPPSRISIGLIVFGLVVGIAVTMVGLVGVGK